MHEKNTVWKINGFHYVVPSAGLTKKKMREMSPQQLREKALRRFETAKEAHMWQSDRSRNYKPPKEEKRRT